MEGSAPILSREWWLTVVLVGLCIHLLASYLKVSAARIRSELSEADNPGPTLYDLISELSVDETRQFLELSGAERVEFIKARKKILLQRLGEKKAKIAKYPDRYGLKLHFLKNHLASVGKFYRRISESNLQSETTVKVKERLEKNRSKC